MPKLYNQLTQSLEQAKSNWKCDWKWRLKDYKLQFLELFFYSWYGTIRSFVKAIVRTVQWLPIVWNNYDWDHVYLLKVMHFKIKRMRKYHEKYRRHVGVERTIKQLNTCELLLDRLIKDNYIEVLYDQHNERWYPGKDLFERLDQVNHNPQERREFKYLIDHEDYMRKQDTELFCKIFSKHNRTWWD